MLSPDWLLTFHAWFSNFSFLERDWPLEDTEGEENACICEDMPRKDKEKNNYI